MRLVLIRCLVVVLAIALIGGLAHADLHLIAAASSHQHLDQHDHPHFGMTSSSPHQHYQPVGEASCCCDGLACASAYKMMPARGMEPVVFDRGSRYRGRPDSLPGQALPPDPKPPRPIALT